MFIFNLVTYFLIHYRVTPGGELGKKLYSGKNAGDLSSLLPELCCFA